jgi:cytochrome c oxidase cbb3-type subunit 3
VLRYALLCLALIGCKKSEAATMETKQLFASTCARCHGPEGTGGLPLFDGGPSPRNFHDHAFQMDRTDEQLKQTIKNGKGTGMPAFGAVLNDDQIAGLVLQVRSFDVEKKP